MQKVQPGKALMDLSTTCAQEEILSARYVEEPDKDIHRTVSVSPYPPHQLGERL